MLQKLRSETWGVHIGFSLENKRLFIVNRSTEPIRPKVTSQPISQNVLKYGYANLTCTASSYINTPIFIYWYHGNKLLPSKQSISPKQEFISSLQLYQRKSTLHLSNINFEDAGYYLCHVSNIYGSDWSSSANLTVVGKRSFGKFFKGS